MTPRPVLSIVAPVYNEEKCIEEFFQRLNAALQKTGLISEVVFVDDGSTDSSLEILRRLRQKHSGVKILGFSRNFGHQIAVKAGVDHAEGEAVVIIDTDLQDPPETVPEMVAKWREGYDVVYAVRAKREGEGFFKRATAALYYRLIKGIANVEMPLDTGDFRLISRRVAEVLKAVREKHPYVRGLVSWAGFSQTGIPVSREARFAGRTKYSLRKMWQLAWNGITHFSFLPLQVSTYLGLATAVVCFAFIFRALYVKLVLQIAVPGWTSLMVAVLFLGSVQLVTLGILGSYLARNYDESRARPLYILRDREGF